MKRWLLSPAATADIEGIAAFLDEQAPHATTKVLEGIREAIEGVATTPGMGHLREDLAGEPLGFLAAWSYLVIHRPSSPVEIVRVLHASRDVAGELARKRRRRG